MKGMCGVAVTPLTENLSDTGPGSGTYAIRFRSLTSDRPLSCGFAACKPSSTAFTLGAWLSVATPEALLAALPRMQPLQCGVYRAVFGPR
ncbi:hypothetical protein MRX96_059612 [Rhipicephalus microplus]